VNFFCRFAFCALLLAPGLAFAQSLTVHGPFELDQYQPLDGHERWQRWWSEDGGSSTLHLEGFGIAAAAQTVNSPTEWGRTARGYARRTGDEYGRLVIQNSIQEGLASIERTDTRYFACGCDGFFPRAGHAVKMTLLTYTHDGHKTLDLPQLAGAYGSSMIGTMWWPRRYSPLVEGVQTGHIEVGIVGVIHLAQEFSPELKHFFHLDHRHEPGRSAAP
jgi:hypothetical protein